MQFLADAAAIPIVLISAIAIVWAVWDIFRP